MAKRGTRIQVDSGLGPERLQPQAGPQPFDMYRGGDNGAGRTAKQVAEGLAQLSPAMARLSSIMHENMAEEQSAAGEAALREDTARAKEQWKGAVKQRIVSPHQNPFFIAAYKRTLGEVMAGRFDGDLKTAMAEDETLDASTDPQDFDTFASGFREKWLAANDVTAQASDPHFQKGFGRLSQGVLMQARSEFSTEAGKRIEQNAQALFGSVVFDIVRNHGKEPNVVAMIQERTTEFLSTNPLGGQALNMQMAQAIADVAIEQGDSKVLALMDKIPTTKGAFLGGIDRVRDLRQKADRAIVADTMAGYSLADRREQVEKKAQKKSFWADFTNVLQKEPQTAMLGAKGWAARYAEIDPEDTDTVYKAIQTGLAQRFQPDPDAYSDALLTAYGTHPEMPGKLLSERSVGRLFAENKILPGQMMTLMGIINQRPDNGGGGGGSGGSGDGVKAAMSNPLFDEAYGRLKAEYGSDYVPMTAPIRALRSRGLSTFVELYSQQMQKPEWAAMGFEEQRKAFAGMYDQALMQHSTSQTRAGQGKADRIEAKSRIEVGQPGNVLAQHVWVELLRLEQSGGVPSEELVDAMSVYNIKDYQAAKVWASEQLGLTPKTTK